MLYVVLFTRQDVIGRWKNVTSKFLQLARQPMWEQRVFLSLHSTSSERYESLRALNHILHPGLPWGWPTRKVRTVRTPTMHSRALVASGCPLLTFEQLLRANKCKFLLGLTWRDGWNDWSPIQKRVNTSE